MVNRKSIAGILLLGIVLITVIAAAGCVNTEQTGTADTLFLGNVITMDDANPMAEAVAVKDGIIIFVGSEKDAKAFCDENTEIIDYGEYSIYPGFLEAHAHVSLAGVREYGMAKLTQLVPLKQTLEEMQAYIQENPGKEYYYGSGWSFTGEEPTAAMLDTVNSDVPVILNTMDGHSVWVNSKALEVLNYTPEEIKEMGPAEIRVNADGNPTGYMSEKPALDIINNLPFTVEELKEFTLKFQEDVLAKGFTGICDAGMELSGPTQLQVYEELIKEGKLKLRIYGLSLVEDNTDTPEEDMAKIADLAQKLNSEYFKIIGAKVFMDGIVEAHTAWMLDEYKDQAGYYGVKRFDDVDKLSRLITAADKYGMLVHVHSIGDAASRTFADAVEKSVAETGNYDQRNAAAHLQYIKPEDIKRFGELGIVAVSGYQWCPNNTDEYKVYEQFVGAEYAKKGYPAKSFIDAGAVVVAHTDYPITPSMNIPDAICLGVTRTGPSYSNEGAHGLEEAMTREETLESMTTNVAYMWHEEDRMGSLEAGKLANMAVFVVDFLNDDINAISDSANVPVVATIVDGKVVYQADEDTVKAA